MKRLICSLLAFLLMTSVAACVKTPSVTDTVADTSPMFPNTEAVVTDLIETKPAETEKPIENPPVEEVDYKTLKCNSVTQWTDIGINWNESKQVIVSKFPAHWRLVPAEGAEDETLLIRKTVLT